MRVNADGSDPRMIVIGAGEALEPAGPTGMSWSPDSRWIALDGLLTVDLGNNETTDQRQVFEYRTDASDLFNNLDPTRQITHETDLYGASFPQFTPDGSQILYAKVVDDAGNEGNFSYLVGVDGTNRHEVFLSSSGLPEGEFVPTATPGVPPPLVDMTHITVPAVDALDLGAARNELETHNLTVGTVTYTYSPRVGRNRVVSQTPAAGAVAHRTEKQGPPVNLVVSRGAAPSLRCVVPKVKGKSLHRAKRALTAAHCRVGRITRAYSRTFKKGHVVSARPGAGKKLPAGAKIALAASKGRRG
jgi:hypothetical protein